MFPADGLAALFANRRWFGHNRTIRSLRVVDAADLGPWGDGSLWLVLTEVTLADGATELFQLPVLRRSDDVADATEVPDALPALGQHLRAAEAIAGERGRFLFHGHEYGSKQGPPAVRRIPGEQSNTSLIFDDTTILKLLRHVTTGPNPDIEMTRTLGERGFAGTPAYVGSIAYEPADGGPPVDLGVATRFLAGAQDAWTWLLAAAKAHVTGGADGRFADLRHLGEITADLHTTLARPAGNEAFAPTAVTAAQLTPIAERALAALRAFQQDHPGELAATEGWLAGMVAPPSTDLGTAHRIHGDYHLGQVLTKDGQFFILDFEGEPTRPLAERRAKQSPLRDVAGMLRSLGYAAGATLLGLAKPGTDAYATLQPKIAQWESAARENFLNGYLSRAAALLPAGAAHRDALLRLFEIDKALYEVEYERRFRPDWLDVPLLGLRRIDSRIAAETSASETP